MSSPVAFSLRLPISPASLANTFELTPGPRNRFGGHTPIRCTASVLTKSPGQLTSFLTARLWDKHLPKWRENTADPTDISMEAQAALLELINRFTNESTSLGPSTRIPIEEVAPLTIQRRISSRKGKWRRFSPEAEAKAREAPRHK